MIWFEDKQIAAELLIMRDVKPENWTKPLEIAPKPTNVINATYEGRAGAAIRNLTACLRIPKERRHDVDKRYYSTGRAVRADLLPAGYLARHHQRRIENAFRLMFLKPRYVKPVGVLRRDLAVRAKSKND